jgi:hypothetical protein
MTSATVDPANTQQVRRKAAIQEYIRSEITAWMDPSCSGFIVRSNYNDDLAALEQLQMVAKRLAASNEAPTEERLNRSNKTVIRPTQTGLALIDLCRAFDPDLPGRHRHHVFNPWIKMMVVAIRNWGMRRGLGTPFPVIGLAAEDRDDLERIARFVSLVSASREFKRKLQNEKARALEDYGSGSMYMIALFKRYACLLILRVDLYFWCEGNDEARAAKAQAVFDRFMPKLRRGRFKINVAGSLSSHGGSAESGVHFHVLVAFDGQAGGDAHGYACAIGMHWQEECADLGQGAFFNSYADRDTLQYNGVGLVQASDWRKLIELRQVLLTMAVSNYLVKLKNRPEKCFRRGEVKRVGAISGSSWQEGHSMATEVQILGV